jgi:F-box-like
MHINTKTHINNLPFEVLEQIFDSIPRFISFVGTQDKHALKTCALVCKYWNVIASPLVWKKVTIDLICEVWWIQQIQFSFLKHITNPNYLCGRYIQSLKFNGCKLYPLAIIKILRRCPNITVLALEKYRPPKGKIDTPNLLDQISKVLPYLKVLKVCLSEEYFGDKKIQEFIDKHENLQVWATRRCPSYINLFTDSFHEYYDGIKKEWICHNNCNEKNYPLNGFDIYHFI